MASGSARVDDVAGQSMKDRLFGRVTGDARG